MKTILYLDHTAKMSGGEIALLKLITSLDRSRYRPIVALASEGTLAEKLRDAGIETHVIPLNPSIVEMRKDTLGIMTLLSLGKVLRLFSYAVKIAKFARSRRVDLIHTNSLKSDLYGGIAGRFARIPVLWHVRDNITSEYLPHSVATAFRMLSRVIPNAIVANSQSTLRTLNLSPTMHFGRKPLIETVPASDVVYSCHISSGELANSKIIADQARGAGNGPVIALIGRITRWKGQHIFIEACAQVIKKFPAARFWIVGSPLFGENDYEREIHKLAADLEVAENVKFLGFRDDVSALLRGVDIVAHASTVGEPFGQVVIEGMAAGKPVIGTDGGALPEIVIPGETGLLVKMGDSQSMADAIETLLANPEKAKAMGAAGRERVEQHFTLEHASAKMNRVYECILGSQTEIGTGFGLYGRKTSTEGGFDVSVVRDGVRG